MKKLISLFILCTICLIVHSQIKFHIEVNASKELDGKVVMLLFKDIDSNDVVHIESGITKDNTFHFKGEIDLKNLFRIQDIGNICMIALEKYPDTDVYTELYLEDGRILVELSPTTTRISGTPNNDLLQTYIELKKQSFSDTHVNFVIDNMSNFLSVKAFAEYHQQVSDENMNKILTKANDEFKNNEKVQLCMQSREIIKSIHSEEKKRIQEKGTKCLDFELITSTGETRKLYDYIGKSKYLVIDFWASWCGPCIKSIPHMESLAEKYKSRGVEFIGISLDTQSGKDAWLSATKKNKVPWDQLSDLEGTNSNLAKAFNVSDVPYAVIVDAEGVILEYVRLPTVNLESNLEKLP